MIRTRKRNPSSGTDRRENPWFEEYMTEDAEIILIGGCKLLRA